MKVDVEPSCELQGRARVIARLLEPLEPPTEHGLVLDLDDFFEKFLNVFHDAWVNGCPLPELITASGDPVSPVDQTRKSARSTRRGRGR
jgi:hypothetical protein